MGRKKSLSDLVLQPTRLVTTICAQSEEGPVKVEIVDIDKEKESSDQVIYDKAYAAGLEEGKKIGLQQARDENATLVRHLKRLFDELVAQRESVLREAETFILRLVFAISKKVIRHELNENPQYVNTLVRETLHYVVDKDSVIVKVNPEDLELIKNIPEDSSISLRDIKRLEFAEDSSIERGGCIIETNSGTIDAQLAVQLEEIEADLLEKALDE